MPPLGTTTSRSDLVAEAIRDAIFSGRLDPDEVLVERRLAEMLGVSKTPVREALIMLSSTGLLTMTRNRGVAVRRLTLTEVRHVYEERALLEPWALASAIRAKGALDVAGHLPTMDEADAFTADDDATALATANRSFHRGLYSQCENPFVVKALDDLQDLTALATVGVLWENWPTWRAEAAEHHEIQQAAAAGEADRAEDLMRTHIERSIARLRSAAAPG
ncbi:GntR family transcriptional regulator [Murinocardiopsis flavida]|uniref:GntR family transcriptional regulator n=2 Tax=Murinocardiopsis flavida TaxID=645275 RepID=A0A2P8CXA3_9ACTN|nr:GntR family transcriptional regulator [Murinocardiopsis flavida]